MPRSHQIAWIAVPYLAALMLILILVLARGGEAPAAQQIQVPPVAEAPQATPPASDLAVLAEPTAAAKTEAESEAQPPETQAATEPETSRAVLPGRAKLFMRPSAKYEQFTRLRAGTKLTLYPDIDAPRGWVLARTDKGTVGYLRTKRLRQ